MSKVGFFDKLLGRKSNAEQDSPKVDKRTLKELQKEIYRRENDINAERAEAEPNQGRIKEKEAKIAADKVTFDARLAELTKKKGELATSIAGTQKSPNQAAQKQQEAWTKELKAVQKEIVEYQELVAKHEAEQKQAAEKLQAKNEKAAEKAKLSYKEEKERTFQIIEDFLKDKEGLKQLLIPLTDKEKPADEISTLEKLKFAWSHRTAIVDTLLSKTFFTEELAKMQAMMNGEEKYDPSNPPFFVRLLKDPDTLKLLERNVPILNSLVAELTPYLTDIVLKEVGKIEALRKEFEGNKKDIDKLPELQQELETLKAVTKKDNSKIEKLQEKIDTLNSIKTSYERALLLQALQKEGIDGQYIKGQLLPVVQELVATVLAKPETLVKVLNLAVDMSLADKPEKKRELQQQILDTIDITQLTNSPKLSNFLIQEGEKLAKAAKTIIASEDKTGVTDLLIEDGVPLVSELVGKILQDPNATTTLYEALKPKILDDNDIKIREATDLKKVAEYDSDSVKRAVNIAAKLPDIMLQDDLLSLLKQKLPGFLTKHKSTLAKMAEDRLPETLDNMAKSARALADQNTGGLDKNDVYKIILSAPARLLAGVEPKFYGQAVPVVIDLVQNVMNSLSEVELKGINSNLKIVTKAKDEVEGKDKAQEEKDKAQGELTKIVTKVLEDKKVQEVVGQELPTLLQENKGAVQAIASNVASSSEVLKQYELSKAFVDSTTSLVVDVAASGLGQMPKLVEIGKAYTQYSDPEGIEEAKVEALKKVMLDTTGVVKELSPILQTTLPQYLKDNKTHLLALTKKVIEQEGVKAQLEKAEISPILVKEMAGIALDAVPELLPDITKLAIDLVQSSVNSLSEEDIKVINNNLKIVMDEETNTEEKDKARGELIKVATHILENKEVQAVIAQELPKLLQGKGEALKGIANKVASSSAVKQYELSKEFVDSTTSLVLDISSTSLAQLPKLIETNNAIAEYAKSKPEEREDILRKIINDTELVVKNLTPVLETAIPQYLKDNKTHLLALTNKLATQEGKFKTRLDTAGVSSELAQEMVSDAIDAVPQLLPIVTKFANAVLADEDGVGVVVTNVQGLIDTLDKEKTAVAESDKEKVKKEIEAKGTALANSVLDFIDNPNNAKVKEVINQDIPKFLEDNAEKIGATLDKFLTTTVVGRNLKIKGEDILKTLSKKVPGIVDIITNYQKGKYSSVMSGVIDLLRDKEVRHLATRVAVEGLRYMTQKSYTSYRTRRNKLSEHIEAMKAGVDQLLGVKKEEKQDLGELLYKLISEHNLGKGSKTIEYMLIDKDFRGLVFDQSNPIPLQNVVVKGFNFDKAEFKGGSFENSEFSNCSFKGTKFINQVKFDGATIDAETLKTLLPAIRKYNKQHKGESISLDNVKIVGDISQVSFEGILMKEPDFTKATLGKDKTFEKDVINGAYITNAKLPKPGPEVQAQKIGEQMIEPHVANEKAIQGKHTSTVVERKDGLNRSRSSSSVNSI